MLTPEIKQKIKDSFNAAVAASPYADEAVEGMRDPEGQPMTRRKLVALTLQDDEFYNLVDMTLSHGKVTLDEFIGKFEAGMKKSLNSGPRP